MLNPFRVSSATGEMVLIAFFVEGLGCNFRDGISLVGAKRSAKFCQVGKEYAFEGLTILAAVQTVVTELL